MEFGGGSERSRFSGQGFCSAHYAQLRWYIDQFYQESGRGKPRLTSEQKEEKNNNGKKGEAMKCCRGPYSAEESCSEGAALHAAPVQPLASSWQSFASAPAPSNKGLSRSWLFPSLPKLPARRQRRGVVRMKLLPVLNSPLISLCRRNYFGVGSILSRKHCMAKATQSDSYPMGQQVIDPTGGENLSYQEHE